MLLLGQWTGYDVKGAVVVAGILQLFQVTTTIRNRMDRKNMLFLSSRRWDLDRCNVGSCAVHRFLSGILNVPMWDLALYMVFYLGS